VTKTIECIDGPLRRMAGEEGLQITPEKQLALDGHLILDRISTVARR